MVILPSLSRALLPLPARTHARTHARQTTHASTFRRYTLVLNATICRSVLHLRRGANSVKLPSHSKMRGNIFHSRGLSTALRFPHLIDCVRRLVSNDDAVIFSVMRLLLGSIVWLLSAVNARTAIMPPPWADPSSNPCAAQPRGWQLLYWPADGKCYKIFQVGATLLCLLENCTFSRGRPATYHSCFKRLVWKNPSLRVRIYNRSALRVRKPWNSARRPVVAEQLRNAGVLRGPHNRPGTLCAIQYLRERPAPRVSSSRPFSTRPINQGKQSFLNFARDREGPCS